MQLRSLISAALLMAAIAMPAHADAPKRMWEDDHGAFTVNFENDLFTGKDNGYTNGIRFGYLSAESGTPDWAARTVNSLPFIDPAGHKRFGVMVGQSMFTPNDIKTQTPSPADRPYAGWFYTTLGVTNDTGAALDTYDLTLGVVGPWSLAADTQKFVHHTVGAQIPQGWSSQLKNEPGVVATYNHKWKGFATNDPFNNGFNLDFTPNMGGSVGNIYTNATAGFLVRFGQNLPEDYGPPLTQPALTGSDFFIPTKDLGWYLFGGAQGLAVARNIFLDGSTFHNSPHVNKKIFVGALQAGLALTYGEARLSYTYTLQSSEFDGQSSPDDFGAVTLSYRF